MQFRGGCDAVFLAVLCIAGGIAGGIPGGILHLSNLSRPSLGGHVNISSTSISPIWKSISCIQLSWRRPRAISGTIFFRSATYVATVVAHSAACRASAVNWRNYRPTMPWMSLRLLQQRKGVQQYALLLSIQFEKVQGVVNYGRGISSKPRVKQSETNEEA